MALLVALVHDAQEIAIMSGTERLDLQTLEEAYKQRLTMMHDFITLTKLPPTGRSTKKRSAEPAPVQAESLDTQENGLIARLVQQAKDQSLDVVLLLKQYGLLEEVAL